MHSLRESPAAIDGVHRDTPADESHVTDMSTTDAGGPDASAMKPDPPYALLEVGLPSQEGRMVLDLTLLGEGKHPQWSHSMEKLPDLRSMPGYHRYRELQIGTSSQPSAWPRL